MDKNVKLNECFQTGNFAEFGELLKFSCEIASYRDGGLSCKISNWMVAVKDGV